MDTNEFDKKALLRCTDCGTEFTTSSDGSKIRFDGVRIHGNTHHTNDEWDYEIIERDHT